MIKLFSRTVAGRQLDIWQPREVPSYRCRMCKG